MEKPDTCWAEIDDRLPFSMVRLLVRRRGAHTWIVVLYTTVAPVGVGPLVSGHREWWCALSMVLHASTSLD